MKRIDLHGAVAWLALLSALITAAPQAAAALDRRGEFRGNISAGVIQLEDDSGFQVGGNVRYYITDYVSIGPSFSLGFTDTVNVYNIRGLARIGTMLGEKSSTPLEIFLEAGAGVIIFDPDVGDAQTDLTIPFGGGLIWYLHPNVSLTGGALVNATTNNQNEFIPEYYFGLYFRVR